MDRALLAIIALMLNAAFAGPRHWYARLGALRLFRFPTQLVRTLEQRLNREQRNAHERRLRGKVLLGMAAAIAVITGSLLDWLFKGNLQIFELLLLVSLLPVRPAFDVAADIRKYLQARDIANARQVLEGTPWRHHAVLDEHAVARAAIEILSVQFVEKIVGTVFWYLCFGLAGLFLIRLITLMQELLPQAGTGAEEFGQATQTAHKLLHYLPSRIAGLLWLCVFFFMPTRESAGALPRLLSGLLEQPSQKLALLTASMVLRVSLGGPASIYGKGEWIENGSDRATPADIQRALYAYALLNLLLFVLVAPLL